MKKYFAFIILLSYSILSAQVNIINNPSLEDWQDGHPVDWKIISFTPDYFKSSFSLEFPGNSSQDAFSQERNLAQGHHGLSYLGLGTNEIIEGSFSQPLIKEKTYTFSCWAAKPKGNNPKSLNLFTVSFSNESLKHDTSHEKIEGASEMLQNTKMVVEEREWKYISTKYVAKGGETKFQLGYFNKSYEDMGKIYYVFDDFQLFDFSDKRMRDSKNIFFKSNQFNVEKTNLPEINRFINEFISIDSIVINGYANEVGDEVFNLELSKKRCLELKTIIGKIKPKTKIISRAKGEIVSVKNDLEEYRKVELQVYHRGKYEHQFIKFDSSLMLKLQKLINKDECYKSISELIKKSFGKNKNYIFSYMANSIKPYDKQLDLQIENIISKYGYPGLSLVSPYYMDYILLLILRSDSETRSKYFNIIKDAWDRGEINKIGYAYLVDKMRYDKKQNQVYGTLIKWVYRMKTFELYPTDELAELEKKRYFIGLPTVKDYLEELNRNKRLLKE